MSEQKFMESLPNFWAGGFLFDAEEHSVLLHLRDGHTPFNPNKWAFFGGINEGQETFGACFVRELREEIGLFVSAQEVIYVRDYFRPELARHRVVFYVRSDVRLAELRLGEGAEIRWVALNVADQYDLTSATRDDLEYFKRHVASVN
jgi:8-oxo-dGTP pyrophosphatase MutT (NUDIX family)